jgi:16S rRNA (adenine1518-N6/adenine1519-N6)-dimethyltransferase
MKARLGQNFLVDAQAQRAIADALGDLSDQAVVEIGPGKAAITQILVKKARQLFAIELDHSLATALRVQFSHLQNFHLIERDVLAVDFTELALPLTNDAISTLPKSPASNKLAIVGNLPYYITSDILLHLFVHHAVIGRAVLMVQREVADRIVAEPGTRDYGMLSATCQLYARVERLFTLPPAAFSPPPQVHSSVIRLSFAPRFQELEVEPDAFIAYLRQCFAHKRKTLANNLRAAGHSAESTITALNRVSVSSQARAETLTLEQHAKVFQSLDPRASSQ